MSDAPPPAGTFGQTVHITHEGRPVGRATWSVTDAAEGLIYISELTIDPDVRRAGHGRRLLREVLVGAKQHLAGQGRPLRRAWVGVGHKSKVIGRSFLTGQGFHHVGSVPGVCRDEDLLVYVKSFD